MLDVGLTAGRDLDIEIAEKVLKLPRCNMTRADGAANPEPRCSRVGEPSHYSLDWWGVDGQDLPAFSADIGAAWQIVEHLVALDVAHSPTKISVHNRAVGPWACHIIQGAGTPEERTYFEYGATAPLAICAAALAVVGRFDDGDPAADFSRQRA